MERSRLAGCSTRFFQPQHYLRRYKLASYYHRQLRRRVPVLPVGACLRAYSARIRSRGCRGGFVGTYGGAREENRGDLLRSEIIPGKPVSLNRVIIPNVVDEVDRSVARDCGLHRDVYSLHPESGVSLGKPFKIYFSAKARITRRIENLHERHCRNSR